MGDQLERQHCHRAFEDASRSPRKSDWWNEISEEEKSAIDKGLADIKAGRVKSHKEVNIDQRR